MRPLAKGIYVKKISGGKSCTKLDAIFRDPSIYYIYASPGHHSGRVISFLTVKTEIKETSDDQMNYRNASSDPKLA